MLRNDRLNTRESGVGPWAKGGFLPDVALMDEVRAKKTGSGSSSWTMKAGWTEVSESYPFNPNGSPSDRRTVYAGTDDIWR